MEHKVLNINSERAAQMINKIITMLPMEHSAGGVIIAKKIATYMATELYNEAATTLDGRMKLWSDVKHEIEKID